MRWFLWLFAGCTIPDTVRTSLVNADAALLEAQTLHAPLCAPEALAHAEASLAHARLDLKQGDLRVADVHIRSGAEYAQQALDISRSCGTADRDGDQVVDVLDKCPEEPEDRDGISDDDGCRDIAPEGDDDRDGVINKEDACIFEAEDFDGDQDLDGCPETSLDRDGDAIIDAVDECPDEAEDLDGYRDSDGCLDPDDDNDLIADFRDRCPKLAEDSDGWQDDDGCPEPDNDNDGVADVHDRCLNEIGDASLDGCPILDADHDGISDQNDRCPGESEDVNLYVDEDGCPDKTPEFVALTGKEIRLLQPIQFETGNANLVAESLPILDEIARVLIDLPALKVRIEGHTDSDGTDEANQALSQDRADAVRAYLVRMKVDPGRLSSIGHGEVFPVDTNRTATGRANNRRVEFHLE